MRQFFITVLGTIVGMLIFIFLIFIIIGGMIGAAASKTAQQAEGPTGEKILSLDLRQSIRDHGGEETLFGGQQASIVNITRALDKAKTDENVKGLFIRARSGGMTPASAEELRSAILNFKSSGKFVIAHSQGFEGTSILGYYAVSAADEIWQQSTTGFAPAGMASETPFYGGLINHFDAKAEFVQFHEYKNAANVYTQSDYTEAHREATTSMLTSIYDNAISHIAKDRGLDVPQVKALLEGAPHSAERAKDAGFIDKLGYLKEARDYAREKTENSKIPFQTVTSYGAPGFKTGPTIAFIGGEGPVTMGRSQDGSNPFSSAVTMGGDTVTAAIDAAVKDKRVKAIIFRVSTPGGSATASDQINAAVLRAKDAGKPVIISMGQYAASGGYYVAAHADKILALPTTITGSIGVLGGKIALEDAYGKYGYNVERIAVGGEYLGVYSSDTAFSDFQREKYRSQMEDIYVDFTELVAAGRDLPIERVREIAKGRVWTGEQAKEIGLVDEFGGILKAIDVAKDMAGIETDKDIYLKTFPRPKPFAEKLQEQFSGIASISSDLEMLRDVATLPEVQNAIKARKALELQEQGALTANIPVIAEK